MPRQNFLLNLGLKLLLNSLEQKEKPKNSVPELASIPIIQGLKQKEGVVILILGRRESGKTVLSQRLAEIIGKPAYAVSPEQKLPGWITELKLEQLNEEPPPYSTLLLDDLPVYASQRDYNSRYVQTLERLIPVCRHKRKLVLCFASQSAALSDRYVMDSDIVIFKQLSILFQDLERPSVAKLYKQIEPVFARMSETELRKHCYIFSHTWRGLARVNLPNG